jgi:pimeloyl-ACP methyl ester carboxylesterase
MPRIALNDIELEYESFGNGFPVIVNHGIIGRKDSFAHEKPSLPNFRLIFYHQRKSGHFTMETLIADLHGLMDYLGIRRAVLCGQSFGGTLSLAYTRIHPERVSGLILTSTFPKFIFTSKHRLLLPIFFSGVLPFSLGMRMFKKENISENNGAYSKSFLSDATEVSKETYLERVNIIRKFDATPYLSEIHAPTLIVGGKQDIFTPVDVYGKMFLSIPNSRLEVMEGAHLCYITNNEEYSGILKEFLSRLDLQ